MGICAAPDNKKPQIKIQLSAKNQQIERQLVEELRNLLTNKGVKIDFSPLTVDRELLYMKINYEKGLNILTLANGTTEINGDSIEKIADEIAKKSREAGY
jgi:hypothetical protein